MRPRRLQRRPVQRNAVDIPLGRSDAQREDEVLAVHLHGPVVAVRESPCAERAGFVWSGWCERGLGGDGWYDELDVDAAGGEEVEEG